MSVLLAVNVPSTSNTHTCLSETFVFLRCDLSVFQADGGIVHITPYRSRPGDG